MLIICVVVCTYEMRRLLFCLRSIWADPGKYALIGAAAQLGESKELYKEFLYLIKNTRSSSLQCRWHCEDDLKFDRHYGGGHRKCHVWPSHHARPYDSQDSRRLFY